jgi:hypothetical protein
VPGSLLWYVPVVELLPLPHTEAKWIMNVLLVSKDAWKVLRLPYSENKNMVKPVLNVQFTKSEFLNRKFRDFNMPIRSEIDDSESCGSLGSSTVSHCTIQNQQIKIEGSTQFINIFSVETTNSQQHVTILKITEHLRTPFYVFYGKWHYAWDFKLRITKGWVRITGICQQTALFNVPPKTTLRLRMYKNPIH